MPDCPTCLDLAKTITALEQRLERLETALRDGVLMIASQVQKNQKKS